EQLPDARDREAVAHELVEAPRLADEAAESLHLFPERPVLHRTRERDRERLHLHGLGYEIVGPGADRGDRRLEAAKGRDDDDRDVGPARDDALAERQAVHAAPVEGGEAEVDLVGVERRHRGLARGVRLDLEAAGTESRGDRLAHLPLVVDDEDASAHHSASHTWRFPRPPPPAGRGRKIENRLPFPTSLPTSIQPPRSAPIPCAPA